MLFRPRKLARRRHDPHLKRLSRLDRALVKVARRILVLKSLDWPKRTKSEFLARWHRGNPRLPKVEPPVVDYESHRKELIAIARGCGKDHPVADFIRTTAESYVTAILMVESAGTSAFTELAQELYGRPSDPIGWHSLTHLGAADHFIETTREIISSYCVSETKYCLTARYVAGRLRSVLKTHFKDHDIKIVVDPRLASKACSGGKKIRVRAKTCFSEMDIGQLVNHEGFVHMLTMINGREQPHLRSLGLAAPRTAKTQEGMATFAELMTGTIDLHRLLRIALRIRAVHMALEGADFIEIFRYFLEKGQNEEESFQSARRIFRGGDPAGGIAFTKDVVYLQGLILTHTFFRKAMQRNKFYLAQHLFSGRMTLGDAISLDPYFASGFIKPPYYVPPWFLHRECFAAHLCYNVFANKIQLT